MKWAAVEHSKNEIDRAGQVLATLPVSDIEYEQAWKVLNNWRAAHGYALNSFQYTLRHRVRSNYECGLVAQRLKRSPSIIKKLVSYPKMKLSQMQDLAGCRAVVTSNSDVSRLKTHYLLNPEPHQLNKINDYIEQPKSSGYRSVHLVFRFFSKTYPAHCGRHIELQIRSRIQHAWATAVETVGTFLGQPLKANQGDPGWLRFFALASSIFAMDEGTPLVPGTPADPFTLLKETRELEKSLDALNKISLYGQSLKILSENLSPGMHQFMLILNPVSLTLDIRAYHRRRKELAAEEYLYYEKQLAGIPGADVVLVKVDSVDALRRAFPNYYLDTKAFFQELDRISRENGQLPFYSMH